VAQPFLNPEQIDAARRWIASTPASYRRRGKDYFHAGAVTTVACEVPGELYRVQVQGQRLYEVTLDFADGGWDAECTCPMLLDCKHCVAALLALLNLSGSPVSPNAPPPPATLDRALREKLGRALTIPEAALVKQVRALHQRYAGYGGPYLSELQRLFKHVSGSSWEQIRPLPGSHRDEVAWWSHLAVVLRDRGGTVPEFLLSVVDEAAVRNQIAGEERERQIASWRHHLAQFADEPVTVAAPARTIAVRLKLTDAALELETRAADATEFRKLKITAFRALAEEFEAGRLNVTTESLPVWLPLFQRWQATGIHRLDAKDEAVARILGLLLRQPATRTLVVHARGEPFTFAGTPLRWEVAGDANPQGDYTLRLVLPDGTPAPAADWTIEGEPTLYVIGHNIFPGPRPLNAPLHDQWGRPLPVQETFVIPAPALETQDGFNLLHRLGAPLPAKWRDRVQHITLGVRLIAKVTRDYGATEWVGVRLEATGGGRIEEYLADGWEVKKAGPVDGPEFRLFDRAALAAVPAALQASDLKWDGFSRQWRWRVTKHFPVKFAEWLAGLPPHIEVKLDATLASLRDAPLRGKVRLDCESAGMDWFDLKVVLDVADTKLSAAELKVLLDARGGFVRIEGGGWRRLQFDLDAEDDARLAQLGLSPRDFSSEPQRLHALQLADNAAARFLPPAQVADIRRRAGEIKTRVSPPLPATVRAELRPYQVEGFHFLAYLSTNNFGGVLADDMGLGKTLQTLAWLEWLRAANTATKPVLVVCPKSVKDNWRAEAERFVPGLRVTLWHGTEASQLSAAAAATDLLVINYAQLRSLAEELAGIKWLVVVLDEGQYIKNPESQTAKAARALIADHRLILTGTPIENRLLDLWSLMSFSMPGVLGPRARFAKLFDQAGDPLARQRLAARVRPFLLRRTKAQVAPELPDRMEEDLYCEMEPAQATLYRAELKQAQQQLLKLKTAKDFDRERFNFLTSLLRLRQICCHPALLQADPSAGSAKVEALLDLLEPLLEEGHKALVFSQFVTMIDLLQPQLAERGWKHFVLTGVTENRGPLVAEFQKTNGAAVFLISLKAGGFGLNLTAASYVVLFDPWWNPAVENQAIDRTHRIGQTRPVNAYRLLIKDSIEEKIRKLQQTKSALAADVLGEERFAQSLTLDDLKFLLADSA
jgi:hypothetical protein